MTNTLIGYARCSTDKQNLTAQRRALIELGVPEDRIYTDLGLTSRPCPAAGSSARRRENGRTTAGPYRLIRTGCPSDHLQLGKSQRETRIGRASREIGSFVAETMPLPPKPNQITVFAIPGRNKTLTGFPGRVL
jgi:hypothetical protein